MSLESLWANGNRAPFSIPVATTTSEIRSSCTKLQLVMILKIQTKDALVYCPHTRRSCLVFMACRLETYLKFAKWGRYVVTLIVGADRMEYKIRV